MNLRKKRVLKRNDYRNDGFRVVMPSGVIMVPNDKGGVSMIYPCLTERWISNTWYDDVEINSL